MANSTDLDDFDRKILRALQANADYSMAELGDIVGLSHTPCWRRIKRLEAEGIIEKRVTLLNAKKLHLGVTVYAHIKIRNPTEETYAAFETAMGTLNEIVECCSTCGDMDYQLKIVAESVEQYDHFLRKKLMHLPNVDAIHSTFALRQVKFTTSLPI